MANFNFTFQPGMSSEQMIGFEMAGRIWSEYIQDDTIFNVHVMLTDKLPSSVVGGAIPVYVTTDISTVESALARDATSTDDAVAIANLNTTVDSNGVAEYSALINDVEYQASELTVTRANAKALGFERLLAPDTVDGYVVFSNLKDSTYSWNYDFSRTSESSSQQIDFLGMALHEIGHIMGFTSGIDMMDTPINSVNQSSPSLLNFLNFFNPNDSRNTTNQPDLSQTSVFDLFRYSEQSSRLNAQELTIGEPAYFSIDGGQTSIAPLSSGLVESRDGVKGYQASHWDSQASTNASTLPVFPSIFDFIANPLASTVSLASGILSLPSVLLGQRIISRPSDTSQLPNSLGIMDSAIVSGSQPTISNLDLRALDVIGYNLSNVPSTLDYVTLLQDTQADLAQEIGVGIDALDEAIVTSSLVTDQQATLDKLLERRLSRVSNRPLAFFQEVDMPASSNASENPYITLANGLNTQMPLDTNGDNSANDNSNGIVGTATLVESQPILAVDPQPLISNVSAQSLSNVILVDNSAKDSGALESGSVESVSKSDFTLEEDPLLIHDIGKIRSVEPEATSVQISAEAEAPIPFVNNTTRLDFSDTNVTFTRPEIFSPNRSNSTLQKIWSRPFSSNYQNALGTSNRKGLFGRGYEDPLSSNYQNALGTSNRKGIFGKGFEDPLISSSGHNSIWDKGVTNLLGLGNIQKSFW